MYLADEYAQMVDSAAAVGLEHEAEAQTHGQLVQLCAHVPEQAVSYVSTVQRTLQQEPGQAVVHVRLKRKHLQRPKHQVVCSKRWVPVKRHSSIAAYRFQKHHMYMRRVTVCWLIAEQRSAQHS